MWVFLSISTLSYSNSPRLQGHPEVPGQRPGDSHRRRRGTRQIQERQRRTEFQRARVHARNQ